MQYTLLVCYFFLMLLGVSLLTWIIPNNTQPGFGFGLDPDVFPTVISWVLLLSSINLFIKELLRLIKVYKEEKADVTLKESFKKVQYFPLSLIIHLAICMMILLSVFPLIEIVGFFPPVICSIFLLQFVCGGRNYKQMGIISIVTALVEYYGMQLLNIPLP